MSIRHAIHLMATLFLMLLLPAAAMAAPAGDALLQSYAGEWRGRGTLKGEVSETVVCRLSLKPAGSRFSYAGRCVLAGETISLRGSLEFDEKGKAFVARSGTKSYKGVASGGGVVFTMSQPFRREGHSGTFSAGFSLTGGTIKINFRIEDSDTGVSTARVPLKKS